MEKLNYGEEEEKYVSEELEKVRFLAADIDPEITVEEGASRGGRGSVLYKFFKEGKEIGEFQTGNLFKPKDAEITEALKSALYSAEHEQSPTENQIDVTANIQQYFNKFGIRLEGNTLYLQKGEYKNLDLGGTPGHENKSIEFIESDEKNILVYLEERNGRKMTYTIKEGVFLIDSEKVL